MPRFGPNSVAVRRVLDHASALLPSEAQTLSAAMTASWSWGRTDSRFPPFIAALGAACHVAVSSGRMRELRAARVAVAAPPVSGWDRAAPVALVGVRITVAAMVVADLLTAEQRDLLLGPWHAVEADRRVAVPGAA
ncbi:MAG: hypothetical protein ACT4OQ_00070 [Chloroflexota bacterium]